MAGGTLWLSLVLRLTLVVLSSESLRSSFICLPSRGCYRDGVVLVRCRTRGPQGEEVKAVLVASGVGGDLNGPGCSYWCVVSKKDEEDILKFGENRQGTKMPARDWVPVSPFVGGHMLSRPAVIRARVLPSEEGEALSRDWF